MVKDVPFEREPSMNSGNGADGRVPGLGANRICAFPLPIPVSVLPVSFYLDEDVLPRVKLHCGMVERLLVPGT